MRIAYPIIGWLPMLLAPASVDAHGYMYEPATRNYYAHEAGTEGSQAEVPKRAYCHHCLNSNAGICGVSQSDRNFDIWVDSQGNEMPWLSQQVYTQGQIIEVHSHLASHHNGHMELRGCPNGKDSTDDCFEEYVFTFVEDMTYQMPGDPNYPERGYYWGGQGASGTDFSMKFKIPASLVGDQIMLQWKYITANSCSPPGYSEYFGGANANGEVLPSMFWSPGVSDCTPPYPLDGSLGGGSFPEVFTNCAEVTIIGNGGPITPSPLSNPTLAPVSLLTESPVQAQPAGDPEPHPTPFPVHVGDENACCSQDYKTCISWCPSDETGCTACSDGMMAWLPNGPISGSCLARWTSCTENQNGCCDGLLCRGDQYYMQCKHPDEDGIVVDPNPTDPPATATTPSPTKDDRDSCGSEWADCFQDNNSCCEDLYCDTYQFYAQCRRKPDGCLQEWAHCNANPSGCCLGLTCSGDPAWMMCQKL